MTPITLLLTIALLNLLAMKARWVDELPLMRSYASFRIWISESGDLAGFDERLVWSIYILLRILMFVLDYLCTPWFVGESLYHWIRRL